MFKLGQRCIFTGVISNNNYIIEIIATKEPHDLMIKIISVLYEDIRWNFNKKVGQIIAVNKDTLKILKNQNKIYLK